MKNNGFTRFEVIIVILLILCVGAYLAYTILGGSDAQKYNAMKKSATNFSKSVVTNVNSFSSLRVVYLSQAIDDGCVSRIKSPFSEDYCSVSESKVVFDDDATRVTLKCDEYLIDGLDINDNIDDVTFYKVSDWSLEKPSGNYEERVLYNCLVNGQEDYREYYEEYYFVSIINRDYGKNFYSTDEVNSVCKVISKTFYRTKEEIK